MGAFGLIPPGRYASIVRLWAVLQTIMHLLWAFTALLYFARGMFIVAWALPVFLFACLLGTPLYLGSFLYRSGARDLVHGRRRAFLKLAVAPPLSAALLILMLTQLRHSPEQLIHILQNPRSIEVFCKFAYPIATIGINLCLWLTLAFIGAPGGRRANPLPA